MLLSSEGINWPSYIASPSDSIPNYFGPLVIETVDSTRDNVTLRFPHELAPRFSPTFHTSVVKPFVSRLTAFPSWRDDYERPMPVDVLDGQELFEVDRIVEKRTLRSGKVEYLLGFRGYPDSHNQWYPFNRNALHDWKDEWGLLERFDPTVGPYPTPPIIRRSTRSSRR